MADLNRKCTIGFIGAGVLGNSLALALSRQDYTVAAVTSRSLSSAQALADCIPGCQPYRTTQEVADAVEAVFITTPDDAICPVASAISWRSGQGVVHCSGAASLEVFDEAIRWGAVAGAFHPLQAFSSVENGVKSIRGTTFGIEGNDQMRAFLRDMAVDIGGHPIFLKSDDKPMYHLSGVMMGNLLSGLGAVAAQLWEVFGFTRAQGVKALMPMMRQVSINMETSGVPQAIAGPYVRGDIGTVRKHLETLQERAPTVLPLYCELAMAGLPFAVEKGALKPDRAAEIRRLVEQFRSRI